MIAASATTASRSIRWSGGRGRAGRPVDAALLHAVLLPPPAAGAFVLSRGRGSRAGLTADGGVAVVVEHVIRDVVVLDVVPDLRLRPACERGDLRDPVMERVRRDRRRLGAGRRLRAPEPCDPRLAPFE